MPSKRRFSGLLKGPSFDLTAVRRFWEADFQMVAKRAVMLKPGVKMNSRLSRWISA